MEVSRLGAGTVQFGSDYGFTRAKSQPEVDAILDACELRGITLLDTAPAYGDSERKIGDYLRRRPGSKLTVATKLKTDGDATESVRGSLEALGLDRLAFLQLHRCDDAALDDDELWSSLRDLRSSGLVSQVGLSVYEAPELESALAKRRGEFGFVQLPYSVLDQRLRPWLPRLKEAGVGVISRSALLKGLIPAPDDKLPPGLENLRPAKARLRELAAGTGLDPQTLALLFCAAEPGIDCTLVGMDSPADVEAAHAALSRLDALAPLAGRLRELAVDDPALVDPRRWAEFK